MTLLARNTASCLIAAVALLFTVAACGSTNAPKVNLTFWSWVPGIDKVVDLWNQENPDVHVELSNVPAGGSGGYAKMRASLTAGDPPDLAQVEYQEIPSLLVDQGLEDLTSLGIESDKSKFVDWQWQQGVFNDRVYAVPQASGPMAMFYRQDLFKKWNIEPPRTWADFEAAAKVFRKHHTYIATFPAANSAYFGALSWQAGARWFGTQGGKWTVDVDNPATRKVAKYWNNLVKKDLVKTEPDMANGWFKDIQDGQITSWVGPQWGDALLRGNAPATSGKWKVAPMPQWSEDGKFVSSNWGGSSTVVMHGSDHAKEALRFAIWLNTDADSVNMLIKSGYGWPAVKSARDSAALNRKDPFFGNQRYNKVFAAADAAVDTRWQWSPTTAEAYEHFNNALQGAVDGTGTFAGSLPQVQDQIVKDLEDKGLPVDAR